ncbi:aminoacyl-tRNA hydrolase, partial [Patescibacteria group bacterium]
MKLIVGLGNPGKKYDGTRHNIGFAVVDRVCETLFSTKPIWNKDASKTAIIIKHKDYIFAKPTTFMNVSGNAVQALSSFYKIKPVDIWIIHDEIDLPLGTIRIRTSGGSAGHNGVQSIIDRLGTDAFVRFRLGVGNSERSDTVDHVLSRFDGDEKDMVNEF